MKKLIKKLLAMFMVMLGSLIVLNWVSFTHAQQACDFVGCPEDQLTTDPTINDVGDNPISQGAGAVSERIKGLKIEDARNSIQARDNLLMYIKVIVDYLLGFLSFVVLLYTLWGGYEMVTAAGDENKYSGGIAKMKRGLIVIVGIGISWYIISLVFEIVNIGIA